MFILKVFRYLKGSLKIKAYNGFPERIINICYKNQIPIWNIKNKNDCIYFFTDVKGFRNIRYLKRNTDIRLKVLNKYGFPFFISKRKDRFGLIIGAVLFFVILNFLSMFVWNINIAGNKNLSSSEIIALCDSIGIKEGIKKSKVESALMRNEILLKTNRLSWISFNVEGSVLNVNVSENNEVKKQEKQPSNLIATSDGIIKKIEVKSGDTKVQVNTAVKKGDLLVSGITEYQDGVSGFINSSGEIYAETETKFTVSTPLTITKTITQQKCKNRYMLTFFGINIPLYLGNIKGEYNINTTVNKIQYNNFYVPIYLTHAKIYNKSQQTVTLTLNEAKKMLTTELDNKEKNKNYSSVISKTDKTEFKNNVLYVTRTIKGVENIAEEKPLTISK